MVLQKNPFIHCFVTCMVLLLCPQVSESMILAFAAHLKRRWLCSSVYLAAVRFLHVSNGFTDPLRDRPRIKRAVGLEANPGPKLKLPITHEILAAIKAVFTQTACAGQP